MRNKVCNLIYFILIVFAVQINAQDTENGISPLLNIANNTENLEEFKLNELEVDVKVIGNISTTTYTMKFYNPNNRVMEGELVFPLAEGVAVSRFAMDVNGKIREGVPVEKNKGQQVFESIERRQVDPGLLEVVEGNTFKARVYPIPSKGYKTIVIAYEEELQQQNNSSYFTLPLYFKQEIEKFTITAEVFKQELKPILLDNNFEGLTFNNWEENYKAHKQFGNLFLNHQLKIEIPQTGNEIGVYTEKGIKTGETYFYIATKTEQQHRDKQVPNSISVFWDVSSSGAEREQERELELLTSYLSKMNNGEVELFTFSNTMEKVGTFRVQSGSCNQLIQNLKKLQYDGATNLGAVDLKQAQGKEILLFSDGMSNFGDKTIQLANVPVHTINSGAKADHSMLNYLAISTGGVSINLLQKNNQEALKSLTKESLRFLGASNKNGVAEVYPSRRVEVGNTFTCAGKLVAEEGLLTLQFGYGNEVVRTVAVRVEKTDLEMGGVLEKIWAGKKLWELNLLYEKNKENIKKLGKKYSIVTKNTSLIVLETVEDYVEYEIEPPIELMKEYRKLTEDKKRTFAKTEKETIEKVVNMYQSKINWWNREIKPINLKTHRPTTRGETNVEPRMYVDDLKTVTGIVVDDSGQPIPGVAVVLRGTNQGLITDIEGQFTMQVPLNAVLQYSYIGFITVEQDMSGIVNTVVQLTPDVAELEEVVVESGNTGIFRRSRRESADEADMMLFSVVEDEEVAMEAAYGEKKLKDKPAPKGAIYIKPWTPDAPYIKELSKCSKNEMYERYLKLKQSYKDVPSFYTDASSLMYERGLQKEAVRVVSNLAEVQLSNHELLRVLAHKLEQMKEYEASVSIYKKVHEIRKEEPQSYRDLALVLAKDEQYQESVDIIWEAVKKNWDDRFPGIEAIMVTEMNSIIAKAGKKVLTKHIDERLLKNLPVDIRVVLNWDADNTDMDLWVTDPRGEKCYYSHKETQIGGLMSNDFTRGYGPEEFMLKKAVKGKYKIEANYFGSSQQKVAGPVTIYLELYINYGRPNEELREIILRLSDNKEVVEIGEFEF